MRRKHKRPATPGQAEADAARILEYRLGNLTLICSRVEIRMSDSFVYEIWGQLRHGPKRLGLLRLAAVRHDLRTALGQALMTAIELERPYLPAISPELTQTIAAQMSDEDAHAAAMLLEHETHEPNPD